MEFCPVTSLVFFHVLSTSITTLTAFALDFCAEDLERVKTDNLWMRRFIAAQENDVTKAVEMLYETCQWRKEFGTNGK